MIARYFAYGSNMNAARVESRGLRVVACKAARLVNMALVFDKAAADHAGCAHANLAYAPGSRVEGVLFDLFDAEDILRMDVFERTPVNYSREVVRVQTEGGDVAAWTYFANPAVRHSGLRPDRAYLDHLLAGRAYLSTEYYEWLRRMPCAGDV